MAAFMEDQLKSLGVTTKLIDLGTETLEGHVLKLPPVVLGKIGEDPKKKTVLIYGHFDVQPASHSGEYESRCLLTDGLNNSGSGKRWVGF